jgi:hypothetical protein
MILHALENSNNQSLMVRNTTLPVENLSLAFGNTQNTLSLSLQKSMKLWLAIKQMSVAQWASEMILPTAPLDMAGVAVLQHIFQVS